MPQSGFWIRFNSFIVLVTSGIFLAVSILNFWMGDEQSLTLLLLVVAISIALGLQIYYICGSLRETNTLDPEWNMKHMFCPLVLFWWYSAISCINFVKALTIKYDLEIWKDLYDEGPYEPLNAIMLTMIVSLMILGCTTCCSSRIHYNNSFQYRNRARMTQSYNPSFMGSDHYDYQDSGLRPSAPFRDE